MTKPASGLLIAGNQLATQERGRLMTKQDKITMPFNYSIEDNKDGTFSLLQNNSFLFCGETIEQCFDAMTKVYTCMKYGKSYSKF